MSALANIPVTVRDDVQDFVDKIGERRTYERMLEHIPVHFAGVRACILRACKRVFRGRAGVHFAGMHFRHAKTT